MLIFSGKQDAVNLVTMSVKIRDRGKKFLVQNTDVSIPTDKKTENLMKGKTFCLLN